MKSCRCPVCCRAQQTPAIPEGRRVECVHCGAHFQVPGKDEERGPTMKVKPPPRRRRFPPPCAC